MVEAQAITTLPELERIAPEWERLWAAAHASVFQSPAWLLPWWRHVGEGELASLALRRRDSGALVGFAPLYIYTHPETHRRHLFPLGIATSDRLDIVALDGWTTPVSNALAAHLTALHGDWDVFEAPQVPEGAALLAMDWPAAFRAEVSPADPNPVLPLPAALPANMAQNLAYYRRRAARLGEVSYDMADARSLSDHLDALDRLHARRWAQRDLPGVLRGGGVLDWHRDAARRLLAAGLLRLLSLRVAGRTVAVLYLLVDAPGVAHRRWSYYIGGFDPDASSLSPGTLLVGHAIEQACADGAEVFDFLRGAEPYKQRWGAVEQRMATLRVHKA
jgi:CelD/BcsL family acetyltransferase involved in cellulose biosynthesis